MTARQMARGPTVSYAMAQDLGGRSNQEDRYAVAQMTTADGQVALIALVADGIGGHNHGEVASAIVAKNVPAYVVQTLPASTQVGQALRRAVEKAGQDIYDAAQIDRSRSEMGTTCTAIAIVEGQLYVAHVGDSRLYLLRRGELRQLSIDHNWGEEALRSGFSPEAVRRHPNRGLLLRHLGIDPTVEVDVRYRISDAGDETANSLAAPLPLSPGDVLMLCSDGLANAVSALEMARILGSGHPNKAAAGLVQHALRAGASDNLTAVVLRIPNGKLGLRASLSWLLRGSN